MLEALWGMLCVLPQWPTISNPTQGTASAMRICWVMYRPWHDVHAVLWPPQICISNGQQTMGVSLPWAISAAFDARDPGRWDWLAAVWGPAMGVPGMRWARLG